MTAEELEVIDRRLRAASPGEWKIVDMGEGRQRIWIEMARPGDKNNEFIVAAPEDVRSLSRALRRAWGDIQRLEHRIEEEGKVNTKYRGALGAIANAKPFDGPPMKQVQRFKEIARKAMKRDE